VTPPPVDRPVSPKLEATASSSSKSDKKEEKLPEIEVTLAIPSSKKELETRNKALIEVNQMIVLDKQHLLFNTVIYQLIKSKVKNEAEYTTFKELSRDFLKGVLSPTDYYYKYYAAFPDSDVSDEMYKTIFDSNLRLIGCILGVGGITA